ncbi:MAG: hypothetical protein VX044_07685, partial [Planctomycetota bacterium]|nr:hypothetical protein [Planctomycetota bacterium]
AATTTTAVITVPRFRFDAPPDVSPDIHPCPSAPSAAASFMAQVEHKRTGSVNASNCLHDDD